MVSSRLLSFSFIAASFGLYLSGHPALALSICESFREEVSSDQIASRRVTFDRIIQQIGAKYGQFELLRPADDRRSVVQLLDSEQLEDNDIRYDAPISDEMTSSFYYEPDLTGGGRNDLVIEGTGGTHECHMLNVFIRGADGKLAAVCPPDFGPYRDGFCERDGLTVSLVRFQKRAASFALVEEKDSGRIAYFYPVRSDGSSPFECRVELRTDGRAIVNDKPPQYPERLRSFLKKLVKHPPCEPPPP